MNTTLCCHIKIAIVDDHPLMRIALADILCKYEKYQVQIVAKNGKEFIAMINNTNIPDIVLLDLSMPEMDGFEILSFIRKKYKNIKVVVLSIYNDRITLSRIINLGANAYISKNAEPEDIVRTIEQIITQGEYFPFSKNDILHDTNSSDIHKTISSITPKEIVFLKYACTGMPYKEIAAKMHVGRYTVDDYRNSLYEKLNIKSRAELMLFAIKHKLTDVEL